MEKLIFRNTYWNYYEQLESDFFSYSPYCEIDECNDDAFSVRYLQLYCLYNGVKTLAFRRNL